MLSLSSMRGVPFDVKTYFDSVESYLSGEKSVDDITRETGMSEATLFNKLHEFREKGRIDPPKPKPTLKRTPEFYAKLAELKKVHPNYGAPRLSKQLTKEFGKISQETTTRALQQSNLQLLPKRGDSTSAAHNRINPIGRKVISNRWKNLRPS
jgi:transposase-like protein